VQVRIGVGREVVVDGKVDALNVDATAKDVGGDADALVKVLELLVALDAGGLLATSSPRTRLPPSISLTAPPG
jgi:hypothetical protein